LLCESVFELFWGAHVLLHLLLCSAHCCTAHLAPSQMARYVQHLLLLQLLLLLHQAAGSCSQDHLPSCG
jgi:hypothetical protein